ncbi:MAG: hypothetical protein CL610_08315 [Anaerolineaceae bacterium]|nr:hypothetical protein [Anaerolineaceae bacterium]
MSKSSKVSLSRRDFLRSTGTAAVLAAVPGVAMVAAQDSPDEIPRVLEEVTFLSGSPFPPPTPRDQNTYWQEIESRLGVRINFQLVPRSDYDALLGTTLASGDLPDALGGGPGDPLIRQALLDGAFVWLDDFGFPGDYRGLDGFAEVSEAGWRNSAFNGRVNGVPTGSHDFDDGSFIRTDWLEATGMEKPTTLEELTALMQAFAENDPDGNGNNDTFAYSIASASSRHDDGGGWRAFTDAFGIPNNWELQDDGTLLHKDVHETTRAATEHMRSLVSLGIFNPDFLSLNSNQANEEFASGISGGLVHNLASGYDLWGARVRELIDGADVTPIDPVTTEGFERANWLRPEFNTVTQIRFDYADDEDRLWDLLRIIHFWFDPATKDFVNFGFEGEHHIVTESGALEQTEKGSQDIAWIRAWNPRHVNKQVDAPYVGPETFEQITEDTARLKQWGLPDPTWGLFPELGFEDPSATLSDFANNTIGRMVVGEQSMDEWDTYVEEWYNRGGRLLTDTMTALYQQFKG